MKAVINRKTYNTDTAKKLGTIYVRAFGDPAGYEESLYQTRTGAYFFYGLGGAESKYPEEAVCPVKKAEAEAWLKANQ